MGTALVVLSWTHIVNDSIRLCGFGLGLVGTILTWGLRLPKNPRAILARGLLLRKIPKPNGHESGL